MGWVAAQVAAAFMAWAAVQIPIFITLRVIKVVIISNLARGSAAAAGCIPESSKAAE